MNENTAIGNYGIAPNELLNDVDISLKAKGLYCYIQSKPESWTFSLDRIASQTKDGITSVRAAVNELLEKDYLSIDKITSPNGGCIYQYKLKSRTSGFPIVGFSDHREIEPLSNKDFNSNKDKIENTIADDRFEKFWKMYKKDIQKEKCYSQWKVINTIDKDKILIKLPKYILSTPDIQFRKNPLTYLNNKVWDDEVIFYKEKESEPKAEIKPASAVITVPDNY